MAFQLFSQTAPDTIVVNFLDIKHIEKYKSVIYDSTYVLKIENLNKSLFIVESTVSQQDYNTSMPGAFKGIKLPGYLSLSLPKVQLESHDRSASVTMAFSDLSSQIENDLKKIEKSYLLIRNAIILNNGILNLLSSCNVSYFTIDAQAVSMVKNFTGANSSVHDTLSAYLKSRLETGIQNAVSAKIELDSIVPLQLKNLRIIMKTDSINISKYEKILLKKRNPTIDTTHNIIMERYHAFQKYTDSLKSRMSKAPDIVLEVMKFRDENKIQELIDNFNKINYYNFTFLSDPAKAKSDILKFDIKIKSEKQLPCNIPSKISISETYRVIGGMKVDFSTGIFLNWGNQDFLGRDIQYKNVNDSTVKIESKDGGSRALLSVGALMHIYCRSGGKVNWAISPGVSTTTAFDGINLHLGASLILGAENRFIITLGGVVRESKILDRNYSFDTLYSKKDLPAAPPTIKVFPRGGLFLGLTYNFSKFNAQ